MNEQQSPPPTRQELIAAYKLVIADLGVRIANRRKRVADLRQAVIDAPTGMKRRTRSDVREEDSKVWFLDRLQGYLITYWVGLDHTSDEAWDQHRHEAI